VSYGAQPTQPTQPFTSLCLTPGRFTTHSNEFSRNKALSTGDDTPRYGGAVSIENNAEANFCG
jgi:hypothetical protein